MEIGSPGPLKGKEQRSVHLSVCFSHFTTRNFGTSVRASFLKPIPIIYLVFQKYDLFIYLIEQNVYIFIY